MLKKRIAKWSLDRKRKQSDMLVALRLAFQREAQGKKTVFWIRGRLVTFQDVKQYFQRKRIHDLQSLMANASTTIPTTHIDCCTPEPDAVAGDRVIHDLEVPTDPTNLATHEGFNIDNVDSPIVALPVFNQVDPVMPLNATMSQLEQLLHLGRAYYDGVFEKPHWRSIDNTFQLGPLERFYHHMFDGQILLERHYIAEAFQHFDLAFDLIRNLLNRQVLLFLPYLYHMMLQSRQIHRPEVFSHLLSFLYQICQTCYPQQHPIRHSITILHNMSIEDRAASSKCSLQSIADRLQVEFEADVPDELELGSDAICSLGHQLQTESPVQRAQDAYKLTSIAVWKLINEAAMLKLISPEHSKPSYFKLLYTDSMAIWHHVDLNRISLPPSYYCLTT